MFIAAIYKLIIRGDVTISEYTDKWREYSNIINGQYSGRSIKYSCTIKANEDNTDYIYNLVPVNRGLYTYFSKALIGVKNKEHFKFLFQKKSAIGVFLGPFGMPSAVRAFKYNRTLSNSSMDAKYKIKTNNVELFNQALEDKVIDLLRQITLVCFEMNDNNIYILTEGTATDNDELLTINKLCHYFISSLREKEIIE